MLVGREAECGAIERVLAQARAGEASSVVLRGEPGVGKTSLLRFAIERAGSMRVVRATGIESEAELEYSALLEVCRPLLAELEKVPPRQANELRVALGLAVGSAPDRFGVGAATLSLLAAAAESTPVVVAVDDAQWLDHASAGALLFAARRLLADRVAVLFAARDEGFEAAGIEELRLAGLDPDATAALVERATGRRVAADVAAALHAATGGNPLALLELPDRLDPAEIARSGELGRPLPVTEQIERAFARRLDRLPDETRRALCVLAAAGTEALALPLAAIAHLGLAPEVLAPAEDAGLIAVDADAYRFQHPLLRAVAYHNRPASERRAAHRALAEELSQRAASAERTAWHLAAAAVGVDDPAAEALAAAAESALARGGHSAAAAALERSARLASAAATRVRRLADAAELAWHAGESTRAAALADEAVASTPDVRTQVRLLTLAGRIELQEGRQARARELFLDVIDLLRKEEAAQTIRMLGFVVFTCINEGRIREAVEFARRARSLADESSETEMVHGDYLLGRALLLAGQGGGAPLLAAVVERVRGQRNSRLLLTRLAAALAAIDRVEESVAAARQVVALSREESPMVLLHGLSNLAGMAVRTGWWSQTLAACAEGSELAGQLGQDNVLAVFLSVQAQIAAARGQEESCRRAAAGALAVFERNGSRAEAERVRLALALLDLGRDRLPAAIARLEALADAVEEMGLYDRDLSPEPELVEALVHVGRVDDARRRFERWLERGTPDATLWAPPLAARCHGLLAGDADFQAHFELGLELHARTTDLFQLARTHLAYGQRLRRSGRRVDARRQLRTAIDLLERLEAVPWAEQARTELRASGEKLRRAAIAGDELTPQELQIALQVAEGKQNKEVAAAMFLSPKTVEFHLGRIYRKLGIGSRAELVRRYAHHPAAVPA